MEKLITLKETVTANKIKPAVFEAWSFQAHFDAHIKQRSLKVVWETKDKAGVMDRTGEQWTVDRDDCVVIKSEQYVATVS